VTNTSASGLNILVLVGDWVEDLQLDDRIIDWVRHINGASRPVMSICHGTQVLAAADILRGRRCTGHPCCRPQAQSSRSPTGTHRSDEHCRRQ
jgi:protease I